MTTTNDDKDWEMENNERFGRHLKAPIKIFETRGTKNQVQRVHAINLKHELSKVHSEEGPQRSYFLQISRVPTVDNFFWSATLCLWVSFPHRFDESSAFIFTRKGS